MFFTLESVDNFKAWHPRTFLGNFRWLLCMWVCARECRYPLRPKQGISPYRWLQLSDVGAWNWMLVFYNSRMCSELLSIVPVSSRWIKNIYCCCWWWSWWWSCVWFPEDTHSTVSSRIELGSLSGWCKQTVSSAEPSFWPRQVDFKIQIPLYWRESLHLYLGHMVWRGGVISSYLYLPGYRSWSGGKFLIHTDNWTF